MVKRYMKKPIIIEALQFEDTAERIEELSYFVDDQDLRVTYKDPKNPKLLLKTFEGEVEASVGDYIIKGIQGEFYPCKPDIFNSTYNEV